MASAVAASGKPSAARSNINRSARLLIRVRFVVSTVALTVRRDTLTSPAERNVGWRLDYIFVSPNLAPYVVEAEIHCEIKGSDHCPVSLTLAPP